MKDDSTQRDDIQQGKPVRISEAPHVYPGTPLLPQIRCLCTSLRRQEALGQTRISPHTCPINSTQGKVDSDCPERQKTSSFALRNECDNHANSGDEFGQ